MMLKDIRPIEFNSEYDINCRTFHFLRFNGIQPMVAVWFRMRHISNMISQSLLHTDKITLLLRSNCFRY